MKTISEIIDKVHCAECLDFMRDMPDGCVDTIITDPPYGLGFMGKDWDTFKHAEKSQRQGDFYTTRNIGGDQIRHTKGWSAASSAGSYDHSRNREFQAWFTIWAQECLRVAKPGAILMAFGGTRTYHRLACAIEDAGWEIRDCIQWIYGSGFPKSLDISKAIDKAAGVEREVVGTRRQRANNESSQIKMNASIGEVENITAPATSLAKLWDGWGTALKPSWEPIIVAMKPLDGTFARNAEKHGVAGLWIDGGRIATGKEKIGSRSTGGFTSKSGIYNNDEKFEVKERNYDTTGGRFPSNTILSCTCEGDHEPDCPVRMLDERSGLTQSRPSVAHPTKTNCPTGNFVSGTVMTHGGDHNDSGGASRFFYCAKSSRAERNAGCEGMEAKVAGAMCGRADGSLSDGKIVMSKNHHPTVKPLALIEYLCKLTKTPTGGIVLDPFGGSCSTAIAAYETGRHYILIEKEQEYVDIGEKRIQAYRDKYALFEDL